MSELKQLKKNDFIAAIGTEPTTIEQVTADLSENYEFLDSYVDYLTDHFVANGRLVRNEDGTIQRKSGASRGGVDRDVYQVRVNEDGAYQLVKATMRGNLDTAEEHDEDGNVIGFGWSFTANGAIKRASSHVFAGYKAASAEVKELIDQPPLAVAYGEAETIEVTDEEVAADEYE